MTTPKKIYLSPEYPEDGKMTRDWCENRISPDDTGYVREDLVKRQVSILQLIIENAEDTQTIEFWQSIHDTIVELKRIIQ